MMRQVFLLSSFLAMLGAVAFLVPLNTPGRTRSLGAVPPRSPRPEQYYDSAKTTRALQRKYRYTYNPEYDDDIAMATRKLFELRMRKSQRLPFKSHEFKELRKFIARLHTQKRADELRAAGVDPRKRKPKTRRERMRLKTKAIDKQRRHQAHLQRAERAQQRRHRKRQFLDLTNTLDVDGKGTRTKDSLLPDEGGGNIISQEDILQEDV
mmetsp:Transcript_23570/g.75630  ORF Transcript_23570/g.75630 Transcript_23570/m.75630 type:complete len:209 (-) Transcript_23570:520-1146(-)